MSGAYSTTFAEMQAGASHIDNVNADIMGRVSSLEGQLAPLAGAWQGSASTAFQNLMVRYRNSANRIQEALTAIAEQVRGSSTTYAAEEENQQQSMNHISNALDG